MTYEEKQRIVEQTTASPNVEECQRMLKAGSIPIENNGAAAWGQKFEQSKHVGKLEQNLEADRLEDAGRLIIDECGAIRDMLLEKNGRYGNSALRPLRLFSKAEPGEGIRVRIDDKLSRLRTAAPEETEDVILDLIGYLVLLRVSQRLEAVTPVC